MVECAWTVSILNGWALIFYSSKTMPSMFTTLDLKVESSDG